MIEQLSAGQQMILTVAINAAVVWGVMKTEMRFLRRDTDKAHDRIDDIVRGRCPSWRRRKEEQEPD
jgi:hypothetical protein